MHNRKFTFIFRIMHWALALCILLLLFTVFLRLTWLNKNNLAEILNSQLTSQGITLSQDQLITIAKSIRKPMWDWHIYLGYATVGLFVLRMLLPAFGEMKFRSPLARGQSFNEKLQAWLYIGFYALLFVSLFTGLLIEFGPESWKHTVEEIHELALWYVIPFLVLHVGGVLIAELGRQRGLFSKMISGDKKQD